MELTPQQMAQRGLTKSAEPQVKPLAAPVTPVAKPISHTAQEARAYAISMAKKYGLDAPKFLGQIEQESGWNAQAKSKKDAFGYTQLLEGTAKDMGVDRTDWQQNIEGGAKYMRYLLDRYDGDYTKALAAYNAGLGNVDKHGGVPPFSETKDYLTKVETRAKKYGGAGAEKAGGESGPAKWNAVASDPRVKDMSDEEYSALRDRYFKKVLAPKFESGELEAARAEFFARTDRPGALKRMWEGTKRMLTEAQEGAPSGTALEQPAAPEQPAGVAPATDTQGYDGWTAPAGSEDDYTAPEVEVEGTRLSGANLNLPDNDLAIDELVKLGIVDPEGKVDEQRLALLKPSGLGLRAPRHPVIESESGMRGLQPTGLNDFPGPSPVVPTLGEQWDSGVETAKQGWHALNAPARALAAFGKIDSGARLTDLTPAERKNGDVLSYWTATPAQRIKMREVAQQEIAQRAEAIADSKVRQGAIPREPAAARMVKELDSGKWGEAWSTFIEDPWAITQQFTVESAPLSIPSLAAIPAGLMGGTAAFLAAITAGSAAPDFAVSLVQFMGEEGVNVSNPNDVERHLQDPEFIDKMGKFAAGHAGGVAFMDLVGAGLTSPLRPGQALRNVGRMVGNALKQSVAEGAGEAAGTALGQNASGQKIDIKASDVLAEVLGALGAETIVETAGKTASGARRGAKTAMGEFYERMDKAAKGKPTREEPGMQGEPGEVGGKAEPKMGEPEDVGGKAEPKAATEGVDLENDDRTEPTLAAEPSAEEKPQTGSKPAYLENDKELDAAYDGMSQKAKEAVGQWITGKNGSGGTLDRLRNAARALWGGEKDAAPQEDQSLLNEIYHAGEVGRRKLAQQADKDGNITLFRGLRQDATSRPPLESYTTDERVAKNFAGADGKVERVKVPVKDVVLFYGEAEGEVIVRNAPESRPAASQPKAADPNAPLPASEVLDTPEEDGADQNPVKKADAEEPPAGADLFGTTSQGETRREPTLEWLKPSDIRTEPETFQFRQKVNKDTGTDDRLEGIRKWDPQRAGDLGIFRRKDGSDVVFEGHHRLDKAKELEVDKVKAWVYREEDGWTEDDVRVIGALTNIAQGNATPIDVSKVLRDSKEDPKKLIAEANLPTNSQIVKRGEALANLSDEVHDMVEKEAISERVGVAIGETLTKPEEQLAAVRVFAKASPASIEEARIIAQQIAAAGFVTQVPEQGGLFGSELETDPLIGERARVLNRLGQALAQDAKLFGMLERQAGKIEGAGNKLVREVNAEKADQAKIARERVLKLAFTEPKIKAALDKAARDYKASPHRLSAIIDELKGILSGDQEVQVLAAGAGGSQAPAGAPKAGARGRKQSNAPRPAAGAEPAAQARPQQTVATYPSRIQAMREAARLTRESGQYHEAAGKEGTWSVRKAPRPGATPLNQIAVEVPVRTPEGESSVEMAADEAVDRIDEQLTKLQALLECLSR